jgi:hypothetical protein
MRDSKRTIDYTLNLAVIIPVSRKVKANNLPLAKPRKMVLELLKAGTMCSVTWRAKVTAKI